MKLIFVLFLLCLYTTNSFCQTKEKISVFKDSKVKVINFVIDKDPNKLPLVNLTIQNNTRKDLIFTKAVLILMEFRKHPLSSSSSNELVSRTLTPIAGRDLAIPDSPNTYKYG